jgi:F0F1-type ATP synthase delta subunit
MKISADAMATALYLTTRSQNDSEAAQSVGRFVELIKKKFGPGVLNKVLAGLPTAAKKADAVEDVIIESARPISPSVVEEILRRLGIDPTRSAVDQRVSPELIGGVRIKYRDKSLDASIRGKIRRLAAQTAGHSSQE